MLWNSLSESNMGISSFYMTHKDKNVIKWLLPEEHWQCGWESLWKYSLPLVYFLRGTLSRLCLSKPRCCPLVFVVCPILRISFLLSQSPWTYRWFRFSFFRCGLLFSLLGGCVVARLATESTDFSWSRGWAGVRSVRVFLRVVSKKGNSKRSRTGQGKPQTVK